MNHRTIPFLLPLAAVLVLAACGGDATGPVTEIEGVWGAEHHELVADADGARLEYDCAHGAIDGPLLAGDDGRFEARGTHTREGGPVDQDDPPVAHPALYEGRLLGDRLEITVTLTDTGEVIGPYTVRRGVRGALYKCL